MGAEALLSQLRDGWVELGCFQNGLGQLLFLFLSSAMLEFPSVAVGGKGRGGLRGGHNLLHVQGVGKSWRATEGRE